KWFFEKVGHYEAKKEYFFKIPGIPIAYWISNHVISCFIKGKPLDNFAEPKVGLQTGNNDIFLRLWHEVAFNKIGFGYPNCEKAAGSKLKWFPYNKGGEYRKWYGNNEYIVNWENDGFEIKNYRDKDGKLKSRPQNTAFYFKRSITWSFVSSSYFGVRYSDQGFIFDVSGSSLFPQEEYHLFLTGLLCAKISTILINVLNPTISFQVGDIASMPVILPDVNMKVLIDDLVKENIQLSRSEWDSFETSWDFKKHPLLIHKGNCTTIEQAFNNWTTFTERQFNQLKANEEELNRIFIEIYGLQDELTPEVEDKNITIRKADRIRDIKSFISYAVGCMFGRYSIDAEGLIYAGGDFNDRWKYDNGQWKVRKTVKDEEGKVIEDTWVDATFAPDMDNVLPITDDEYFEDDIVSRFVEFLKVIFSGDTLEENLDYIAEALGRKPSETSRQAIRRYFMKDFYKDHVQAYQKRPIYWLFDSGKQDGFKALIYMHRYDEFTVARVRTDYLHRLQKSYEAEIKRLDIIIDSNASQREKANARGKKEQIVKQMEECLQYDQVIAHVANQRIKIDLDDGVKENYARFQGIEIPQGEGRKPLKADLLAKIL
ncbi:MAG TPA: BREX-1 system adenine-specific DNA-methyltransferase PglX, partial [Clostridiaceae bacterium]|nr:BREX-1 system adenine-specific DNA-methyltransferase PglX [Clostridiaceae bacterium]